MEVTNNNKIDPGFWIGLLLVLILMSCTMKCQAQTRQQTAQIDTMMCHYSCITKVVQTTTSKGTAKYYAIYDCKHTGVSDMIPISPSVMEYINLCKTNGIEPSLAIRLRNGIITSIIKYKPKYIRKR